MKQERSSWKAVLFDMDGVILDSMDMHYRLWRQILAGYGIRLSKRDVFLREGEKAEKSIREIFRAHGQTLRTKQLARMFRMKKALLKAEPPIRIFTGIRPLLNRLKHRGVLLGLVTGTRRRFLRRILPVGIKNYFDVVVTSDDVRYGKPHPQSYRLAAKKLGVRTKNCVIVENAPFGVLAARRAGGFCIGLSTTLGPRYLKKAHHVVRSHAALHRVLSKLHISKRKQQ